jgi:hypothetical protein
VDFLLLYTFQRGLVGVLHGGLTGIVDSVSPMVILTLCCSEFYGLMLHTNLLYVICRPCSTRATMMNSIMSIPFMSCIPLARWPNSSVNDFPILGVSLVSLAGVGIPALDL